MTNQRDAYLETEIMTATPQKLRKMLLDGALKFALKSKLHSSRGEDLPAIEALTRCRAIVSELLSAIKPNDEVAKTVAGIYVFLMRELIEIQQTGNYEKLMGVIGVLEIERETWRQLCEKLPEAPQKPNAGEAPREISASEAARILENHSGHAPIPNMASHSSAARTSFAIDA